MDEEERKAREGFAADVLDSARKHQLVVEAAADSMLTMLVGVYISAGLTREDLARRMDQAWKYGAKMMPFVESELTPEDLDFLESKLRDD